MIKTLHQFQKAYRKKRIWQSDFNLTQIEQLIIICYEDNQHDKSEWIKQLFEILDKSFLCQITQNFSNLIETFVGEYISKGELLYYLKQNEKFSQEIAKFYAAQILLSLEYLNQNSIVYRDSQSHKITYFRKDTSNLQTLDYQLQMMDCNSHNAEPLIIQNLRFRKSRTYQQYNVQGFGIELYQKQQDSMQIKFKFDMKIVPFQLKLRICYRIYLM
ncbi:unnamed protein product [Paramecium primaurelia]|uniref:Protein kinase domain-containing protein n=1 Tax=Paramecium primaurelia TaxID=5886 RepID=A0A8S1M9I3_PARPR|nr:unnamed protein product [Paramecium primaurelia]